MMGVAVGSAAAKDLAPGDLLPDCSKIPLIAISDLRAAGEASSDEERAAGKPYTPPSYGAPCLEDLLLPDGVVIVHFCSPRAPRKGAYRTYLIEELSALEKAAHSVPYPCVAVPVVPLGEKGRLDTITTWAETKDASWAWRPVYYEPTFPRPGLYRTFRPAAATGGGEEITTSWTYLIGPDRRILAVRPPGGDGQLYDWLQQNLPATVAVPALPPSSKLSAPDPDPWNWPAFRRSVRRESRAEPLPNTQAFTYLAWQDRAGPTFASPVVADGRVFVNTDRGGLRVVSLDTGARLGSYGHGASWWTSPAVAGKLVYTIFRDGTVVALDRMTLKPAWQQSLGCLVTSSPAVNEGALYVGARDGGVYSLDAATGAILWRFQTGGEVSSSPALADGLVVIGSGDRNLYALDARTGQEKWEAATEGAVDSSPTVSGKEVFVGSFDGSVYSFGLADGKPNWRCQLGGWVHSSPAVDATSVFVGTVNIRRDEIATFNWVDRASGKLKGRFEMPNRVYSSATVWGDLVLIGCRDGRLYAFDRTMKQTTPLWTYDTHSYVHASPVVVGDTVLVASYDGSVYALRQARPIQAWTDADVVPRWFMAALVKQLHQETAELVARAAAAEVGTELSLAPFADLFKQVKAQVAAPGTPPRVLPRDVPADHPGAAFVEYVLTAGLLGGYPDGTFRPTEPTTRYQFAAALAAVLEWVTRPDYVWRVLKERKLAGVQAEVRADPVAGREPVTVTDLPQKHWAVTALNRQAQRGLLQTDDEGQFRGERSITLKEAGEQWDLIAKSLKVARTK